MKLNYFDLLSPEPVYAKKICKIISPKLKDIASIGMELYQYYLSLLSIDLKTFFQITEQSEKYEALSEEEKMRINVPELLFSCPQLREQLLNALNFFLVGKISFSEQNNCFVIEEEERVTGIITTGQYSEICDMICQRNCISSKQDTDFTKVKSKKAMEIIKKLQKGKADSHKKSKTDSNMELGNIISAVANKSESLNILTIWDLTIFQLWDCFIRLSNNNIYTIQAMSVAAWGDKDKHFDASAWFKKIDTDN